MTSSPDGRPSKGSGPVLRDCDAIATGVTAVSWRPGIAGGPPAGRSGGGYPRYANREKSRVAAHCSESHSAAAGHRRAHVTRPTARAARQHGQGREGRCHDMDVHRIVGNIETADVAKAEAFYHDVLGLDVVMDHGRIRTYGSNQKMTVQVSFATRGRSDTPVLDLSIEVDDIEVALRKVRTADLAVEYAPESEPRGVRRFYARDPLVKLVNVLQHE